MRIFLDLDFQQALIFLKQNTMRTIKEDLELIRDAYMSTGDEWVFRIKYKGIMFSCFLCNAINKTSENEGTLDFMKSNKQLAEKCVQLDIGQMMNLGG